VLSLHPDCAGIGFSAEINQKSCLVAAEKVMEEKLIPLWRLRPQQISMLKPPGQTPRFSVRPARPSAPGWDTIGTEPETIFQSSIWSGAGRSAFPRNEKNEQVAWAAALRDLQFRISEFEHLEVPELQAKVDLHRTLVIHFVVVNM